MSSRGTRRTAVHPHARGEYARRPRRLDRGDRFTPTHVGNTAPCGSVQDRRGGSPPRTWGIPIIRLFVVEAVTVHPHARGEYTLGCEYAAASSGSPPRTWGILVQDHGPELVAGSPPRTWGIPSSPQSSVGMRTVHPHARGEYDWREMTRAGTDGSPPRTWGIPYAAYLLGLPRGSPPRTWGIRTTRLLEAGVHPVHPHARGEYRSTHCPAAPAAVHPHARGEYDSGLRRRRHPGGSPPRTWGILRTGDCLSAVLPVHPHARGEYLTFAGRDAVVVGSPPRTWGIQSHLSVFSDGSSVHPHARGEYFTAAVTIGSDSVHPHARGEYGVGKTAMVDACGSPPRTWGIRRPPLGEDRPERFTPTHVGNTDPGAGSVQGFRFTPTHVGNTARCR